MGPHPGPDPSERQRRARSPPHTLRHTARPYGPRRTEERGRPGMKTLAIDELRERVRGSVIIPEDEGYDEARRVYNGMIDRHPAVVVRAVNVGDVIAGVNFARENQLDLAVRGGGHSVPGFGTCDDGLVIDLSPMRGVRVDPATATARADGGATWGDF